MKTGNFKISILIALVMSITIALFGCGTSEPVQTQPQTYTVEFETFGGTQYSPIEITEQGQSIELLTPEKAGYEFLGWYDNEAFEGEALGELYTPEGNATLYAKWKEIAYEVVFESNGGTEYESVVSNGAKVILPTPEREDYDFVGWYLQSDFSGEALSGDFYPTASCTLYAKWEIAYYEVSFETSGGTVHEAIKVDKGEEVQLPAPQYYGYEFLGWYDNAEFAGEAIPSTYTPTADATLYAKWDKVTYLYLYYGESTDHIRLNYHSGDVITVSEIVEPEALVIDGVECPFVKWCYDGLTFEDVGDTIEVTDEHIYLVATYDYSKIPPKEYIKEDENGNLVTTGKVVKILEDNGNNKGIFSITVSVIKSSATSGVGSAEVAFRIIHNGEDYAVQSTGMYYLMAGVSPAGYVEIHRVTNGTWARFKRFELADAPQSWQDKFNKALVGEKVSAIMTVVDYGDSFEIYLDGGLLYTCTDSTILSQFTGTGFGLRSNTGAGTVFSDWSYKSLKTVSFETNGGNALAPVEYGMGALKVEQPAREGYIFEGWYYDEALTQVVDLSNPEISGTEIKLYAKWTEAPVKITLMSEGTVYSEMYYAKGSTLTLPTVTFTTANKVFTGWYYDEAFTKAVDAEALEVEGDTLTIYAGHRYPTDSALTDNGDGTYTLAKQQAVAVLGETPYDATRIDMQLSFPKNSGGATGIAFRASVTKDETYNNSQYIGITVFASGILQVGAVPGVNNQVIHLTGIICTGAEQKSTVSLAKLPQSWQDKYNAAATGDTVSVLLTVLDYGDTFEIYLDGELAFTYVDVESRTDDSIDGYTGTGYGIRHSGQVATFTMSATEMTTVSFETNGGSEVEAIKYGMGALDVAEPTKEGYIFAGWYYDEALTKAVDLANPEISENEVTLYAKWKEITTVSFETNGGSELESVEYGIGILNVAEPTKEGYIFAGWYYDEALTKAVDLENPAISGSEATLYAKWEEVTVKVTLMREGSVYDEVYYSTSTGLTLPTVTFTTANKVFTGWYYDEAFTKAVDAEALEVEGDTLTIYAGHRYPTDSALTDNGDGTYTLAKQQAVAVLGETPYGATRIDMHLTYAKGGGSTTGIAFRASVTKDDTYNNSKYIGITIYNSGIMQVGAVPGTGTVIHLTGVICTGAEQKSTISLAKLPQSWQDKYNGTSTGDTINVLLTVLDYGDTFEIYLDGAFAFRYVDLESRTDDSIDGYTGTGYGLRHTGGTVTFTMSATEMATVSFETNGGSEVEAVTYGIGALNVEEPTKDGYAFAGWYYDEALTEAVDLENPAISGSEVKLYAKWTEVTEGD